MTQQPSSPQFSELAIAEAEANYAKDGHYTLDAAIGGFIRLAMRKIHAANEKWRQDPLTGQPKERNVGEMLMLIVSEIAEGMEGHRKSLMDDKLPHRPMLEVELADACIRIFDMAEGLGLDLPGAIIEKHAFNQTRPDHQLAARLAPGGKAY